MAEFFNMGGYGGYVWPAYAISAAIIVLLVILIRRREQALRKRLEKATKSTAHD